VNGGHAAKSGFVSPPYGLLTGYILPIAIGLKFSILLTGKPRLNSCRKIFDHGGDLISV
jgi:hypothetical protein